MEYNYKARTTSGQVVEGNIEAPDENTAISILHGKGYIVLSFIPLDRGLFHYDVNQLLARPNHNDVVIFTRQLSTLIEANMPLAESLRTLAKQLEKPVFQKIVTNIADLVEGGSSLSNALASHSKYFGTFYIKLVKSGETTGKLSEALTYLADYLERSATINSKLRSALSYPAFVVFALIVVSIIMMVYVLPQLLSIFEEANATDLPFTTRVLIWATEFSNKYIVHVLIAAVIAVITGVHYSKTPGGKEQIDRAKIKVPRVGRMIRDLYLARISESLATLIKAQIPILDAFRITSEIVGNVVYQKILLAAEESLRGGGSISEVLAQYQEIPPLLSSMIAVGERTGKVDLMLQHVAKFYKTEAENDINNATQLIEPILILVLGLGVAALVSGILLPIYGLVNSGF